MGRILVVEDDHAICTLISDILGNAGLDSVCVRTDRAAHEALTTPPPFQALLVDVNLGQGATGYDVARFARQAIPDIAVVYVSGDASRGTFETSGVPDSDFIAKPFTAAQLLATVQRRIGLAR